MRVRVRVQLEFVDTERVHEVLEARVGAYLAVAVVALHGEDRL